MERESVLCVRGELVHIQYNKHKRFPLRSYSTQLCELKEEKKVTSRVGGVGKRAA